MGNKQIQSKQITEFINSLRRITGIGICFYDLEQFFSYDDFGVIGNRGHYCEFCKETRLLDNKVSCNMSDRKEAVYLAREYKKPFFHECHMGICECVVPVFYKKSLLGIIFLGQSRIKNEDKSTLIYERAEMLGGDGNKLVECYKNLPETDRKMLIDISKVIENYFDVLVKTSGVEALSELGKTYESENLSGTVCKYINSNYMKEMTLNSISNELYLTPSHVARTFKNEIGISVIQYLNQLRCEKAKDMLKNSKVPIKIIAINVGINDANYFTRMFKKHVGMSPDVYRNSCQ